MDNQHRKITGYKELDEGQIDRMNLVKAQGRELEKLCLDLSSREDVDKRWLAIATTDLQKGLMSLTRSIAKPEFF